MYFWKSRCFLYSLCTLVITEQIMVNTSERFCTDITNDTLSPLYIVVPRSRNRHLGSDCRCPILLSTNQLCYSLFSCHCAMDTSFAYSLSICLQQDMKFHVCFEDLNEESVNTRIHFYELLPLSNCYSARRGSYRKYIKAIEIYYDGEED